MTRLLPAYQLFPPGYRQSVALFLCFPTQGVQYDVMDTDARQFDEDFYAFRVVIRELERRLAAIIIQVGGHEMKQSVWF